MTELKPCAYCGSKKIDIHANETEDGVYSMYWVVCDNCGKGDTIPSGLRDEAIKAWNARYEPTCKLEEADEDYTETSWVRCSKCESCYPIYSGAKYCPNCGAKAVEE